MKTEGSQEPGRFELKTATVLGVLPPPSADNSHSFGRSASAFGRCKHIFTPQLYRGGDPLSEVCGRFKRAPLATADASQGEVGGLTPSVWDPSLAPLICRCVRPTWTAQTTRRADPPPCGGRVRSGSWQISRGSGEEPVLHKIRDLRATVPSVTEEGGGEVETDSVCEVNAHACRSVQSSSKIGQQHQNQ